MQMNWVSAVTFRHRADEGGEGGGRIKDIKINIPLDRHGTIGRSEGKEAPKQLPRSPVKDELTTGMNKQSINNNKSIKDRTGRGL